MSSVLRNGKIDIVRARYNRGFRTRFVTVPPEYNTNAKNTQILGAALAAGLYPKLLVIDPAGGMRTVTNQQAVAIVSNVLEANSLSAPQLGQPPSFYVRVRHRTSRLLHSDAVEAPVCLGDRACR